MEKSFLILAVVILGLSSCGMVEPHLSVLRGNYAFGQGRYQAATVRYLAALERGQLDQWVSFNLGNVYFALGENESALGMWQTARASDSETLLFGVHFNTGLLFYEAGRYREAYDEFVRALRLDSTSVEAKINLELALARVQAGDGVAAPRRGETNVQEGESPDEAQRILQFIRRREEPRWFAVDQIPEQESSRDW
jgi:tetratricopeptide (TPR) repeat protein